MRKSLVLIVYAIVGWAACGATVAFGRRIFSIHTTLLIHAVVAPAVFAALSWLYFRRFPRASPAAVALSMVGVVIGLDALVVAPFLERSYAMFQSILGTWIPFASILAASYLVGRIVRGRGQPGPGEKERTD